MLPTENGKSLIYQMFVRAKDFEMNGNATILVISPLVSIIKDQILDMKSIRYSAVDSRDLTASEIRQRGQNTLTSWRKTLLLKAGISSGCPACFIVVGVSSSDVCENVWISLINSSSSEELLVFKLSENKTFLELTFPVLFWLRLPSVPISCFLVFVLSGVTV